FLHRLFYRSSNSIILVAVDGYSGKLRRWLGDLPQPADVIESSAHDFFAFAVFGDSERHGLHFAGEWSELRNRIHGVFWRAGAQHDVCEFDAIECRHLRR